MTYPRRLIEVDLPIRRISAHARREKSIRHGHISTLHIWWARRPLAACRAVICAALWPDPADDNCPQAFRDAAAAQMLAFAKRVVSGYAADASGVDRQLPELCKASLGHWQGLVNGGTLLDADQPATWNVLRFSLLEFIADFANWDASTVPAFLETARALTQAAHEALGGEPGTRPLVVDPFAGGGSIPLEALRVGADAFASDLNPVAVLLNKVVLEYIPRYGQRLADEVRKWGQWVKERAEEELAEFYPKDPDGATPIAYLWARTIRCEGPGCGAEVPLMRATQLSRKAPIAHVQVEASGKAIRLQVRLGREPHGAATVRDGSATCPACGYTTPAGRVRLQMCEKCGGVADSRLFAVLTEHHGARRFRDPVDGDMVSVTRAARQLDAIRERDPECVPVDELNRLRPYKNTVGVSIVPSIGVRRFEDMHTPRQALALVTVQRLVKEARGAMRDEDGLAEAVWTILLLAHDRLVMQNSSLSRWDASRSTVKGVFSKQALQVVWDFGEAVPIGASFGGWPVAVDWAARVLDATVCVGGGGTAVRSDAKTCPLPDDAAHLFFTDPPYFAAIPYADLSDLFYVWLRRSLSASNDPVWNARLSPKVDELVVTNSSLGPSGEAKDERWYAVQMAAALSRARAIAKPDALGCVVFADSSTASWEALLTAIIAGGWVISASWPLDTEMQSRTRALRAASLQSSIFMVCRPRESADGILDETSTGDWRDVQAELPGRIHDWLPRLAQEGVVGADAIFACLGPALEIFSRYARVEKASGERVELREYLEHVWAAVAREALGVIFEGAEAAGLEEDARLTAMWLWTLRGNDEVGMMNDESRDGGEAEAEEDGEQPVSRGKAAAGFVLEYDAARKIAQGLGAHLEELRSVVEVKGGKATLLAVGERSAHLFGRERLDTPQRGRKRTPQLSFADLGAEEAEGWEVPADQDLRPGATVLDRVHQAMLLFGAGRAEMMARFLVEEGAGTDPRFWLLADNLMRLYPPGTDEKRWVDGVLARKKGLGF